MSDHSSHNHGGHSSATTTGPSSSSSASGDHSSHSSTGDHSSHSSTGTEHMLMRPYLFSSTDNFFVLFKQARVGNAGGFVLAIFATFFFGILATVGFEVGKRLERSAIAAKLVAGKSSVLKLLIGALGHGLRLLLHYTAMLLVMTMNIWIIFALLLGHMIGWFLYTATRSKNDVAYASKESLEGDEGRGCDC